MVGLPGHRSRRLHALVITRKDAMEITQALRAAFPSLRITYWNFTDRYREVDEYFARKHEWYVSGGPASGLPRPVLWMRDPRGDPFPYFDSFAVAEVNSFLAWIEPPGWKPRWSAARNEKGLFDLLNRPKCWFLLERYGFSVRSDREPGARYEYVDAPTPRSDDEKILLQAGTVWSQWPKDDKAIPSFFDKVLRIIARLTTNSFVTIGKDYKARSESFECARYYYRAGKDACAWALQRRHNYFQDMWKPGNYPYTPEQRYTEAELLAEREANRANWVRIQADLEEKFRQDSSRGRGSKRG